MRPRYRLPSVTKAGPRKQECYQAIKVSHPCGFVKSLCRPVTLAYRPARTRENKKAPVAKESRWILIFRPWVTTRNGKMIRASDYGLKAFPIWVKK